MTDRLKKLNPDTAETNLPGVCRLQPHRFTDEELAKEFPSAGQEYHGLAIWKDDENIGFLCMELPPGITCTLHLWIKDEYKTKEDISWLRAKFYSDLHPWVKAQGKSLIVVNCAYDLVKTKELFKTFGFNPVPIWIGVQPVK